MVRTERESERKRREVADFVGAVAISKELAEWHRL